MCTGGGKNSLVRVYNFWDGMDGEGWGRICLYYLFHSFICDLMDRRSNRTIEFNFHCLFVLEMICIS